MGAWDVHRIDLQHDLFHCAFVHDLSDAAVARGFSFLQICSVLRVSSFYLGSTSTDHNALVTAISSANVGLLRL